MNKLFVAINLKTGQWYSERDASGTRPTFYRTLGALFNSACRRSYPEVLHKTVLEKLGPDYNPHLLADKFRLESACKQYIKDNKLTGKDLLLMFQDEGIFDIREVNEDEILNLLFQNDQYKLK